MAQVTQQQMLDAGVHFGHLKRKWHPKMAPYIFMEKNDIHLIDLNQTQAKLEEASNAIRSIVRSGRKVLFVATKKQAKEIIESEAQRLNMPYVTERWLGGMLTNFATVRKSIKKMSNIDKMAQNGTMATLSKKERLMISREKEKLQRVLGGIEDLNRLPAALFIVDIKNEHIAVKEAQKLNIPTFAMVDTNSDPTQVDFPIPSNDDATKSIALITRAIMEAVEKGMQERKYDKDSADESSDEGVAAEGGAEEAAVAAAPAAELAGEIAESASDVTESSEEA
ncbi:MAG: 30S ribosomal protein S2 [Cytophagia bacterium]|nr:30S ribosomal protein S2 [Cytophagia bacterium]